MLNHSLVYNFTQTKKYLKLWKRIWEKTLERKQVLQRIKTFSKNKIIACQRIAIIYKKKKKTKTNKSPMR
jgi:hypothetical protein